MRPASDQNSEVLKAHTNFSRIFDDPHVRGRHCINEDLTDASGATFANGGPLESVGILASNVQRSPAASIFALRYDGPTFRLSLRASSSAYRSSDQPFRGGVRKQRSNFAWAAEE